nr:MAG TPA: hypothetical protein [Caudoviricetes sp.]
MIQNIKILHYGKQLVARSKLTRVPIHGECRFHS